MKETHEAPLDIYDRTLDFSVRIIRLSRELQKAGGICRNLAGIVTLGALPPTGLRGSRCGAAPWLT